MQKTTNELAAKQAANSSRNLPPSARNPLCQIANLVFPDEWMRQYEGTISIEEPGRDTLLKISKDIVRERQTSALVWEQKTRGNPVWRRELESKAAQWALQPEKLIELRVKAVKRERKGELSQYWEDDHWGDPVVLNEARERYFLREAKRPERAKAIANSPALMGRYQEQTLIPAAKRATENLWPELWEQPEWHALEILRDVRNLLHAFWRASDAKDYEKQDWYINQVRAYYARLLIVRDKRKKFSEAEQKLINSEWDDISESMLISMGEEYSLKHGGATWTSAQRDKAKQEIAKKNKEMAVASLRGLYSDIERELWSFKPPSENSFWKALAKLQRQARNNKKSMRPRVCLNATNDKPDDRCMHPYFLPAKTRDHCSEQCARFFKLKQNRDYKRQKKEAK